MFHLYQKFTKLLLHWHETSNNRALPWKNEKDPYKIWLSEIILQQTRAQQGLPYYLRFIETFPHINDMAAASDEKVFRLWQGLGYYNRCKNMLATARYIANELKGDFPGSYEDILKLKGVGAYTAAAIASFAFGLPYAVVDGNVYRVLSRYFCIQIPYDTTEGKKLFAGLAQTLIDKGNSSSYNQAIMDLGATVCLPAAPACNDCPLNENCMALKEGMIQVLPVKSKTIVVKKRFFHYLVVSWQNRLLLHKRKDGDIWSSLHEPVLVEGKVPLGLNELSIQKITTEINIPGDSIVYHGFTTQKLTHQVIEAHFYTVDIKENSIEIPDGFFWVPHEKLKEIAFPKTILSFLEKKLYF